MKKTLTYIALTLAWPVLFYFVLGFILWNWDASTWSENNRFAWVVFGFAMCWAAPVFYHNENNPLR